VKLIYVSTGTPTMARDFRELMQVTAPIWVDKEKLTYRHLGFKRSKLGTLFDVRVFKNGARAFAKGFRQGKTQGDPWQQGGVVVVKQGGAPVYGYASEVAGDHPPVEVVMEQARLAARAA
jgi:hypothetical protein